jgi:hypothetical protein
MVRYSLLLKPEKKNCFQEFRFILRRLNWIIVFSIWAISNADAQKVQKVEISEIKKGENTGSFSLKLHDFPREASSVKPYVNRINAIPGVVAFNVLSHPAEKPAQAILTIRESDQKQNIITEVLCALNASSFVFRKKSFSDCNSFNQYKK